MTTTQIREFNASATETIALLQFIAQHAAEAAAALERLAAAQERVISSI